ncbi:hypothetical protein SEA_OLICIOUS_48 [Streptomyces phage Olicious]|uniref:Peptidoglycan binding-like domain-containing protein n=7 Tax=Immanueltrevirus immanuel3 TaxID=2846399 RepID=A0A2H5BMQ0_9CAUD|nr:hypothetical protein HWB41_gp50 [Streptomyces phage Immanuel3]AUG87353.1 hypothetical protein SEA_HAUGEANATOR_48 [Streptomyces phage HaugeAnator]AUG87417.1 hypothetical protein SEA_PERCASTROPHE_48 [Streptomyces phage Percastrophe]AUG87481.1 hypothetical protein SEA_ROMERO_48 [Streptomyces phage Romero]AUG87545.1 hypothetical protein SEA_TORITOKI_48 [Streptomyces phage ToriToki]AUG87609.1 hypothetical protein SEA_ZOOBEAR_48 [Streptomyces phage ZooBear]AZF95836.1 hypothetical protein SEA_OLI
MKLAWYSRRVYVVTTEEEADTVRYVQRVLGLNETGELDEGTQSHIRGLQLLFGLRTTGIIDDPTAEQIERIYPYGA